MSQQSFADLGASGAVCRALSRRGITAPFPVQRLAQGADDVAGGGGSGGAVGGGDGANSSMSDHS